MAKLVISRNDTLLGSRFLKDSKLSIGRASGNDIQLDDPAISKQHAVIDVVGNDHLLLDLGSSNGTFVNGTRVARHLLRHGDVIKVLEFQIRYVDHKSVVVGEGDRTTVISRKERDLTEVAGLGASPVAVPAPAPRSTKVEFVCGVLRVIAGGSAGKDIALERPLVAIGAGKPIRAIVFRRTDAFYLAAIEGKPPEVNGKIIRSGWQRLSHRDFIQIDGQTLQLWVGTSDPEQDKHTSDNVRASSGTA